MITKIIGRSFTKTFFIFQFTDRSTSTGNLLAQKLEQLRKESSLHSDLYEVSNGPKIYEGKMLKKFKPSETGLRRKRSRSMDASSHFRIK